MLTLNSKMTAGRSIHNIVDIARLCKMKIQYVIHYERKKFLLRDELTLLGCGLIWYLPNHKSVGIPPFSKDKMFSKACRQGNHSEPSMLNLCLLLTWWFICLLLTWWFICKLGNTILVKYKQEKMF